jgi:hypothetical protein
VSPDTPALRKVLSLRYSYLALIALIASIGLFTLTACGGSDDAPSVDTSAIVDKVTAAAGAEGTLDKDCLSKSVKDLAPTDLTALSAAVAKGDFSDISSLVSELPSGVGDKVTNIVQECTSSN